MARGWESKSVESQMESAAEERAAQNAPVRTPEELQRLSEIAQLELSRTRVLSDLKTAANPRYRLQLETALSHLEKKLLGLNATLAR